MFDQLAGQRRVLTAGETEEMFLEFVRGTSAISSLRRVERAEEEQGRLAEELARTAEEVEELSLTTVWGLAVGDAMCMHLSHSGATSDGSSGIADVMSTAAGCPR